MSQPLFQRRHPGAGHPVPRRRRSTRTPSSRLVERQIAGGVHGLVPVGTTGESATLSHEEHRRVVELCVETAARPRAGDRRRGLQLHGRGDRAGAPRQDGRRRRGPGGHALLQPASQEGLYRHYEAINEAVQLPVLVYNVPAPHRRGHRQRDGGAARASCRTSSGSRTPPATWPRASLMRRELRRGLRPALRRRPHGARLHRPRRPRLHLGDRQRRAASSCAGLR